MSAVGNAPTLEGLAFPQSIAYLADGPFRWCLAFFEEEDMEDSNLLPINEHATSRLAISS